MIATALALLFILKDDILGPITKNSKPNPYSKGQLERLTIVYIILSCYYNFYHGLVKAIGRERVSFSLQFLCLTMSYLIALTLAITGLGFKSLWAGLTLNCMYGVLINVSVVK